MLPWTEKYRPRAASELAGNHEALAEIKETILAGKKKCILLYGNTGVGKTSLVYAIAPELNCEVVEINASEQRNKEGIGQRIGHAAMQMSLFSRGKIILIDDLDCVSGTHDRGAVPSIIELEKKTRWPMIITVTDPAEEKIKPLLKVAKLIEVRPLAHDALVAFLENICKKESLAYDATQLHSIAYRSGGDMRVAVTDLQMLSYQGRVNDVNELYSRDQEKSVEEILTVIFRMQGAATVQNALQNSDFDLKELKEWLDENIPYQYGNNALPEAYHWLSRADVFEGRIRRWQHWRFLVYINALLSAGIASARKEKNSSAKSYRRGQRGLKVWIGRKKHLRKTEIAEKLAETAHVSKRKAYKDIAPYAEVILKNESI
ncbi:replication factor C large subunit [Candidatus Woesearchaeota archaeon]|nr:replication factor C large subunit [Candidatus Woesearchaeota archaeon]